jgi:8-oxo-dGTP pyrophosphatase MutT (NUDIX family)
MGRSGDGFVRCSDGAVRWGVFGAAGVVFATLVDGEPHALVQQRSRWSHEGGTWSCPGGAIDEGEDPLEAALREAWEEIGPLPQEITVVGRCVFAPAEDWSYTTFVVHVPEPFAVDPNFESETIEWLHVTDVDALPMHRGFAAAWPELRAVVTALGL